MRYMWFLILCGTVVLGAAAIIFGADYTTPNTGVSWTMDDLVANSGGTVTGGAPYYAITGNVTIAASDTVTIAAGSILSFTGGVYYLNAYGTLYAVGNSSNYITFTADNKTKGGWGGLRGNSTTKSNTTFSYCIVEYASAGLSLDTSWFPISNCIVRFCSGDGIYLNLVGNYTALFADNVQSVSNNQGAYFRYSTIKVANSSFNYNTGNGILIGRYSHDELNNCTIRNNGGDGISTWDRSGPILEYCTIESNGNRGIYHFDSQGRQMVIDGCKIRNNATSGVYVASYIIMRDTEISGQRYGVYRSGNNQIEMGNLDNLYYTTWNSGERVFNSGLNILTNNVTNFCNTGSGAVNAMNNYWGATTSNDIDALIHDNDENTNLGAVIFIPFQGSPACLSAITPSNGAVNVCLRPVFQMCADDTNRNALCYKIELATTNDFSSIYATYNQTSSPTGWSGLDTQSNTTYASAALARYLTPTNLETNTTYYWRMYAIAPAGANEWQGPSSTNCFTTGNNPPATMGKTANKKQAGLNRTITYQIAITNYQTVPLWTVIIPDYPICGLIYSNGSARQGASVISSVNTNSGTNLVFTLPNTIAVGTNSIVTYKMIVGPATPFGHGSNTATAADLTGTLNLAPAVSTSVLITRDGMLIRMPK